MTGCWLYDGHTVSGYPVVRFRQKAVLVHRASWEHHHGPIPKGMFVCHRCDTPACCNPDHLFLGTPKDNHADMVRKGRSTRPPAAHGSANANANLTEADIGPICAAYQAGASGTEIAARYGVNAKTIGKVLTGKSWAHVAVPRPRAGATRNSSRNRPTGVIKWKRVR
ncbi:HNH endonuclease signature motif containing protein [Brevundimonas vesicularis]|uniref:HNH endonuclease signature motif containing protein n=1 Tax=Brevundimonas vesicularis TaxID=41276 RepID=UPI00384FA3A7